MRELHDQAMHLAQQAIVLKEQGEVADARAVCAEALRLEVEAAQSIPNSATSEPTRSILYQSAASLAWQSEEFEHASRLIGEALAGSPSPEIRFELLDLLDRVDSKLRNANWESSELTPAHITFRLIGSVVSYGAIPASELITRLESIIDLLSRSAQRMLGLPYRSGGRVPKDADIFEPRVHAFVPGSFILDVELAPKYYTQLSFVPRTTPEEIVANVLNTLGYLESGDIEGASQFVPDPAYLRSFISNARAIAPDGADVSAVEIATADHHVALTKTAKQIPLPARPSGSSMIDGNKPEKITLLEGKLVIGDISKEDRQIVGIQDSGKTTRMTAEEGLEPLVRALFGQQVRAKVVSRGSRTYLIDAEAADSIEDEA